MQPFSYLRPADEAHALGAARDVDTAYIAGGTNLVDLMRLEVLRPAALVDVNSLPLARIEATPDGGVRLGALARNSDVAYHPLVVKAYPALSLALLSGASPQLRHMATTGGNVMQKTRCAYYRDVASRCNKREPGSGCDAQGGYNRMHAVLGGSEHCIAVNPSDMNVALAALDAIVHTRRVDGSTRAVPFVDFHTVPGDHPEIESVLARGELITDVELPPRPFAARSTYVKVRDRASFAFALASAAVALEIAGGRIRAARVALGGVGTKPWRSHEAEKELVEKAPTRATFERAAAAALAGAKPYPDNKFKVELARRTIVRALAQVGGAS
jgi:xanthine dehydrogenase YagS FAD-binding subunit